MNANEERDTLICFGFGCEMKMSQPIVGRIFAAELCAQKVSD
jgi:hypothetical protein